VLDDISSLISLQTLQDYLSEREKAFLVLVDADGAEITLPSRMPVSCFRLAQTKQACQNCYADALAQQHTNAENEGVIYTCWQGLAVFVMKTSLVYGGYPLYIIAGRCLQLNADYRNVLRALCHLPVSIATGLKAGKTGKTGTTQFDLTSQEMAILAYLAEGLANKDIASLLFVSHNTVKSHISHIFTKLGAKNRTEAIVIAFQNGLVKQGGVSA
jgi:DNA-binding CsgD family transcriptional regulator/ligand-binding sensor protein